jgi:hypothetical protein
MNLKSIDVISVRLWFDKIVPTRTPANVFSRFPSLRGSGGTFFMLDQLQGNTEELWGGEGERGNVQVFGSQASQALNQTSVTSVLVD